MKKYLYSYKMVTAGFFEPLFTQDIEPEKFLEGLTQSLAYAKKDDLKMLAEKDIYCLGTIDNLTGEIVAQQTFIAHLDSICNQFLKVDDHGTN